jgi:hypothetical protein
MDAIEMSRAEARDLLILLERLEIETTDVDLLFQIDGYIRILMDRIFRTSRANEGLST